MFISRKKHTMYQLQPITQNHTTKVTAAIIGKNVVDLHITIIEMRF